MLYLTVYTIIISLFNQLMLFVNDEESSTQATWEGANQKLEIFSFAEPVSSYTACDLSLFGSSENPLVSTISCVDNSCSARGFRLIQSSLI